MTLTLVLRLHFPLGQKVAGGLHCRSRCLGRISAAHCGRCNGDPLPQRQLYYLLQLCIAEGSAVAALITACVALLAAGSRVPASFRPRFGLCTPIEAYDEPRGACCALQSLRYPMLDFKIYQDRDLLRPQVTRDGLYPLRFPLK